VKWLLIALASVTTLLGVTAAIGALLPRDHVATSVITLSQPPETVWSAVRDLADVAAWWPDVTRSERLADSGGREVWRLTFRRHSAIAFAVAEIEPPSRLVTQIDAPRGAPFGGYWVYEITPWRGGSQVRVTERGWVENPVYRLFARVVFGSYRTLDGYLTALRRRFGKDVTPLHQ
jgi:uncharacterized protein YndB with AHSA1/START domain